MIRIRTIDHVVLRTARLPEMVEFYCNILGCTLERSLPADVGLTQLRAGNALIDLVSIDGSLGRAGGPAPGRSGNNMDHLCFQLEPFEQAELLGYLEQNGVEAGTFETRYGAEGFGPSMYISDPDGNTVELKAAITPHQTRSRTATSE